MSTVSWSRVCCGDDPPDESAPARDDPGDRVPSLVGPAAGITTSDYWGRRQAKGDHMDATKLLIADHNRVKGLFARFKKASESEDVTAAGLLVSQIMED